MHKRAFTLIELLIVIAIVASLAALLFPALARSKERARQATCESNMKQLGAAIAIYSQDWDEQYPGSGDEIDTSAPVATPIDPVPSATGPSASSSDSSEYGAEPQSELQPSGVPPLERMWSGPKWHDALSSYVGTANVFRCPSDPSDPFVTDALGNTAVDGHGRPLNVPSYLLNGWLIDTVDGQRRNLGSVKRPTRTIILAEGDRDYICTISSCVDDLFHPWEPIANWRPTLASQRHGDRSNYLFADGHAQSLEFVQTISPVTAAGSWPARAVSQDLYNLD